VAAGTPWGQAGGEPSHTLQITELPSHTHQANAINTNAGAINNPTLANLSASAPAEVYAAPSQLTNFAPTAVQITGGSQPHNNMQPSLVIGFCIALQGIFPSRD
jgi:microcystin-dependent protein